MCAIDAEIKNLQRSLDKTNKFLKEFIRTLISPKSWFHNNDPNIIWFDIDKIYELENWVSNITNTEFKLEKINESNKIDCNLKLNRKIKLHGFPLKHVFLLLQ